MFKEPLLPRSAPRPPVHWLTPRALCKAGGVQPPQNIGRFIFCPRAALNDRTHCARGEYHRPWQFKQLAVRNYTTYSVSLPLFFDCRAPLSPRTHSVRWFVRIVSARGAWCRFWLFFNYSFGLPWRHRMRQHAHLRPYEAAVREAPYRCWTVGRGREAAYKTRTTTLSFMFCSGPSCPTWTYDWFSTSEGINFVDRLFPMACD